MNLFEMMACCGGFGGLTAGSSIGHHFGGVPGAIGGGVVGLVVGAFLGSGGVGASFGIGEALKRGMLTLRLRE